MNIRNFSILAISLGMAMAGSAQAQQLGSTGIPVKATVAKECRVTATDHINFPNYDILDKNSGNAVVTDNASVHMTCTGGSSFYMAMGAGLYPSQQACGDYRRMKNTQSSHYLEYSLTHPSLGINTLWNGYIPGRCSLYSEDYPIYTRSATITFSARVKPYQYTARAGQYTDVITIYLEL